ncbi:hypothetical protein [Bradyrhizobium oligotrophicum]|uniref:hypothetical protein n=1 Tax=Bradyrhizobium oligotrophicum TaxID=44255 RepID=UPI003EBED7F4
MSSRACPAQLVVRHFKGDLAGSGLITHFKLLLEQLPSNKQNADEIVQATWFIRISPPTG